MIASVSLLVLILAAYSIFVTKRLLLLHKTVQEAQVLLAEESQIAIDSLKVVQRVSSVLETVSKYPVAENDPHVQMIVKNIQSASDELKQFVSRYTIEENVG